VEIVFIVSREKLLIIELPSNYAPWDSSQYVVIADLFEVVDYARGAAREIRPRGRIALLMVSEHEAEGFWALLSPRVR
jgi:hypothetical protein